MPKSYLEKPRYGQYKKSCESEDWDERWSMRRIIPLQEWRFDDGHPVGENPVYNPARCLLLQVVQDIWEKPLPPSLDALGLLAIFSKF